MLTEMPKMLQECSIVELLTKLEDETQYTTFPRAESFERLTALLDSGVNLTSEDIQRLLDAFTNCITNVYHEDYQCIPPAANAVKSLFRNHKDIPVQNLLPSAVRLLDKVKTICSDNYSDGRREVTIEVFLSYPPELWKSLVLYNSSELIEIFNIKPSHRDKQILIFLQRLLIILPFEERKILVEEGLSIWFEAFIPHIMTVVACDNEEKLTYVECLETLTDALVHLEYSENPKWLQILECICNTQKYPLILSTLLFRGSTIWHRLWIVFIKLLKTQVTRSHGKLGTPINSLLYVVETAFKRDDDNRCRAFQCWDSLIDNFSRETQEPCLTKRINLLLIPMKLNSNVKVESAALAKFNTWWNLIRKFHFKLEKFKNNILISFIHFAFGREASDKKTIITGAVQKFDSIKLKCLQAFVQIVGHSNCNCCVDIPALNDKILNNKLLVSNWNDWLHALKAAVQLTYDVCKEKRNFNVMDNTEMPLICIWKAFVNAIGDLPPNGIRRDMFNGLIQILIDTFKGGSTTDILHDLLVKLIRTLFDDNEKMREILLTTKWDVPPLQKMMSIIISSRLQESYCRYNTEILVEILKPLMHLMVDTMSVDWVISKLLSTQGSLKMWTALAIAVKESNKTVTTTTWRDLLIWPVKSLQSFTEDKYAAITWYTVANANTLKISTSGLDKEINKYITHEKDSNTKYFRLCIIVSLLKNKLLNNEDPGALPNILGNLIEEIGDYREFGETVLLLVDTLVVLLNYVTESVNDEHARTTMHCLKKILWMMFTETKSTDNSTRSSTEANIFILLMNLFKTMQQLFKIPKYTEVTSDIIDELRQYMLTLDKESSLYKFILSNMKDLMLACQIESVKDNIKRSIDMLNDPQNKVLEEVIDTNKPVEEITSPDVTKSAKKTKKKETSIVKTVVENGEEYAVIKSNWKFNPRKLTENQKEKFKRKREDIPALYQDLSQSQDEFKLKSWKTDSQDATTSNSTTNSKSEASKPNDTAMNILKNIQSSDVVPTIIENILADKDKNTPQISNLKEIESDSPTDRSSKTNQLTPNTPKNAKSPRMALKDRVFRNVRNLIEKSSPDNNTKETVMEDHQTDNTSKTPAKKSRINKAKLVNSEPPLSATLRPSRMKRIPKKFENTELIAAKKRRLSHDYLSDSSYSGTDIDASKQHNKDTTGPESADKIDVNLEDKDKAEQANIKHNDGKIIKETEVQVESNIPPVIEQEPKLDDIMKPTPEVVCVTLNDSIDVLKSDDKDKETVKSDSIATKYKKKEYFNSKCEVESLETLALKDAVVMLTPVKATTEVTEKSTGNGKKKFKKIEKQLGIDMVNGNPFLERPENTEKRKARRLKEEAENSSKRKSVAESSSKMKAESKLTTSKTDISKSSKISPRMNGKSKQKVNQTSYDLSTPKNAKKIQDKTSTLEGTFEDPICSEDVIESSQDSTFTTISVPSSIKSAHVPIVAIETTSKYDVAETETQDLLQDDVELPFNKTAQEENNQSELTENMDTEPAEVNDDVCIVAKDASPVTISGQNTAELDTQKLVEADFRGFVLTNTVSASSPDGPTVPDHELSLEIIVSKEEVIEIESTLTIHAETTEVSSPFKDDDQRKRDFLNNTSEISPIKVQSPVKAKNTPPQDTCGDYLVVQLSSPVQSNGEPFDKCSSPEFFSEDKASPDKRHESPPRAEVNTTTGSPSSSLSLKKNRPQAMRPGGRAAQMLGLCVPDSMNTMMTSERELDETKKGTSTPARRNLRVVYNSAGENNENVAETEEPDNFLKFKKTLPSTESSPAVPILKRKLVDIIDDATLSSANKRKRVSFHDPPVSTTVSVQKYIEPCVKSPSSTHKRTERTMTRTYSKSPKRLDNAFVKLDTVLCKAVESFIEQQAQSSPADTLPSLDETPAAEVVITSELNDVDPICPLLVDCKDSIENIATELSSPAMRDLFVKELQETTVTSISDLAKMTEVEVNRLCIKAPKVQVARKVLTDYLNKVTQKIDVVVNDTASAEINEETTEKEHMVIDMASAAEIDEESTEEKHMVVDMALAVEINEETTEEEHMVVDDMASASERNEEVTEEEPQVACIEIESQTDEVSLCHTEMQTDEKILKPLCTQTNIVTMVHGKTQTLESGYKSTSDVIASCIAERDDFVETLSDNLGEASIKKISEKLSAEAIIDLSEKLSIEAIIDLLIKKCESSSILIMDKMLDRLGEGELMLFFGKLITSKYDKTKLS